MNKKLNINFLTYSAKSIGAFIREALSRRIYPCEDFKLFLAYFCLYSSRNLSINSTTMETYLVELCQLICITLSNT